MRESVCVCVFACPHSCTQVQALLYFIGRLTLLYRDPCRFLMGVDDEGQTAVSCNGYIGSPLPIPD